MEEHMNLFAVSKCWIDVCVIGVGEDTFVCQYCDREFPTSDSLIRHEVQHLIGSSYTVILSGFN